MGTKQMDELDRAKVKEAMEKGEFSSWEDVKKKLDKKLMGKQKINEGHYVEARHVCYIIQDMIEEHLIKHAAIAPNKKWVEKLEKSQALINEVYQAIP